MLSVLFYLVAFIIVFVMQVVAIKQKRTIRNTMIFFSFLLIFVLFGFRYEVGSDYNGYINIFNSFLGKDFSQIWAGSGDIGEKLIMGTTAVLHGDVRLIFWIYALLTLYPIYKINKNSQFKYLAYSMLIFNLTILPVCMNIMRQGAAMSFVLLAFDYAMLDFKKRRPIICMGIAIALHTSALLMLPFLILYMLSKRRSKKTHILALLLALGISLSLTTIFKDVLDWAGLSGYDYMLNITKDLGLSFGYIMMNLPYYVMVLFVLFLYRKDQKRSRKDQKGNESDSFVVGTSFTMLINGSIIEIASSFAKNLSRISHYFSIFQVILLPLALQNINRKESRIFAKVLCVSVLIVLFVVRCYVLGYYEIIPYKTWLFMGLI